MGTAQWTEDEITKDHSDADRRVVAKGGDRQLELATPNPAGANYLILTTKSLIHHNGEPYVVGWYLPALVPAGASSTELSWVKAVIDHPPIQCTPAVPYQGVQIRVGEAAVRRNFVGPSGTAPESGS